MVGGTVLCEVHQYVLRNDYQQGPVACGLLAASLPTRQLMLVWFLLCLAGLLSSLAAAAQPLLCRSATACWLSWGSWSCSWGAALRLEYS